MFPSSLTDDATGHRLANNANVTTYNINTLDLTPVSPFQRCCRELRPFSYMSGPSRVQNGSQGLGLPQTEWLGRPASHCGDAAACTTSSYIIVRCRLPS